MANIKMSLYICLAILIGNATHKSILEKKKDQSLISEINSIVIPVNQLCVCVCVCVCQREKERERVRERERERERVREREREREREQSKDRAYITKTGGKRLRWFNNPKLGGLFCWG